ncbi:Crp/Fnr family transcriptional regulator [Enterococcus hirae]|nr:Crp/Fnr family transcriptional regulator [Enterococcus hirae]
MKEERLRAKWKKYGEDRLFNYEKLADKISADYPCIHFQKNDIIVYRGDFPENIYFIVAGTAVGIRDYEDGNEYDYFQLDKTNGSIGLLEVLAQKDEIIATITCLTEVKAYKVPADIVFEWIMNDIELLRLSANLLADDLYLRSANDGLLYRFTGIDRLRYYLISYYEDHRTAAGTIRVRESREKIGNKLGMSIRTVGRSLKTLKESGEIISVDRKILIGAKEYIHLKESLLLD